MEKIINPVRMSYDGKRVGNQTFIEGEIKQSPTKTADTFDASHLPREDSNFQLNIRTATDFTVSEAINRQGSREKDRDKRNTSLDNQGLFS